MKLEIKRVEPVSIVNASGLQRVDISAESEKAGHYFASVREGERLIAEKCEFTLQSGSSDAVLWLPAPQKSFDAEFVFSAGSGEILARRGVRWEKPREWTIYVMVSSHTDIGLHNSQYIQRFNSSRFVDMAAKLCDETEGRPEESRYRYVMEGTWFWSNYPADRGGEASDRIVEDYIKKGRLGVCAGTAGNHTQTYGFEELCRSAYNRRWFSDNFGVGCRTMTMIDNNGLSWSIVQPYSDAGYENIIFAPNQWNPLPSTIWKRDTSVGAYTWCPEAGGGGARVDVRYESGLPMLFWWMAPDRESRLLIWASTQYGTGGELFGITAGGLNRVEMENRMAKQLPKLEAKYPYDLWLVENYNDDQQPNPGFINSAAEWNKSYRFPKIRALGNPDEPFDIVRARFGDEIPTLSGDITGGWYQHPLSAATLLADKFEADRALANAEKAAVVAAVCDKDYKYPALEFGRAWAALIMNDEHSYGTSGYQGRRVYETWMQHRDWIEKAQKTADDETERAMDAIAARINGDGALIFNPTALKRKERIVCGGEMIAELPPFGYKVVRSAEFERVEVEATVCEAPPVLENDFYLLEFAENGSIGRIYDKQLERDITGGRCNEFIYTADNHKSFSTPKPARFTVKHTKFAQSVTVRTTEEASGAELELKITIPAFEKRIELDDRLYHVRDMVNTNRYYRYAYFGFPFAVENCRRICELGGCEAEYGVDLTGHGTDVYMAAHEYCCAENDVFGVGLIQLDSQLVEFDHIHPDKTDYSAPGDGSAMYSYLANDWLQMHLVGGSHLDFRFRYVITSYAGTHEDTRLSELAERIANPPITKLLAGNASGSLPLERSFIETDARLVGLKAAIDGRGIIAHLYKRDKAPEAVRLNIDGSGYTASTIDEQPADRLQAGFSAIRIGAGGISFNFTSEPEPDPKSLEIGARYTGLITAPRAARGEDDGMLYLLWGACVSPELSHYELQRSESDDFSDESKLVTLRAEPEEYVEGRYIDSGLERHREYFYRVRAVSKDGTKGSFSGVFSAFTKE